MSIRPSLPSTCVLGLVLSLVTLSSPTFADDAIADGTAKAEARFTALEARLLEADAFRLTFRAAAEGAVHADLVGTLVFDGEVLTLDAEGPFGGRDLVLEIRSTDEGRLVGGPVGRAAGDTVPRFDLALPEHLREAVVLGFTRMGILHNLALLSAGQPPDHAAEGVGDWLVVGDFHADSTTPRPEGEVAASVFDLQVAGQPAAEDVTLWIDAEGRPVVRYQTVDFPQGQMRVTETYSDVSIDDPADVEAH